MENILGFIWLKKLAFVVLWVVYLNSDAEVYGKSFLFNIFRNNIRALGRNDHQANVGYSTSNTILSKIQKIDNSYSKTN